MGERPAWHPPHEAQALILFGQDPEVSNADVSPATAVALTRVFELVGVLCDHLRR